MVVVTKHKTATGNMVPVLIQIKRILGTDMAKYQTFDRDLRNYWCTQGKPCAKYGKRPCCPPTLKLFNELKPKKYMYLVTTTIKVEDYYKVYPNVKASKSWMYFGMDGTHKMSRNINNKVSFAFEGQAFKVGGCLGCQYAKTGKCKRFSPALEGTGINVVKLALEEFDIGITWRAPMEPISRMVSVGGIYTNESITAIRFKEAIKHACNR